MRSLHAGLILPKADSGSTSTPQDLQMEDDRAQDDQNEDDATEDDAMEDERSADDQPEVRELTKLSFAWPRRVGLGQWMPRGWTWLRTG